MYISRIDTVISFIVYAMSIQLIDFCLTMWKAIHILKVYTVMITSHYQIV